MEHLSSEMTWLFKRVFPFLWFSLPFLALWSAQRSHPASDIRDWFYLPLLLLAIIGFAVRRYIWPLADEVLDAGTCLLVRKGDIEERVSLADVEDVSFRPGIRPARVFMQLRKPGRLGCEIAFIPNTPLWRLRFSWRNDIADSLAERCAAARIQAGSTA